MDVIEIRQINLTKFKGENVKPWPIHFTNINRKSKEIDHLFARVIRKCLLKDIFEKTKENKH
jgi:hypothetical protein